MLTEGGFHFKFILELNFIKIFEKNIVIHPTWAAAPS